MRRAIMVTLAGLAGLWVLCWAVWAVCGYAVAPYWRPPTSQRDIDRQRADAARAVPTRASGDASGPCTYTSRVTMTAARTGVTLDAAWGATLSVLSQADDWPGGGAADAITNLVRMDFLAAFAELRNATDYIPNYAVELNTEPYVYDTYIPFVAKVSWGEVPEETSDSALVWLFIGTYDFGAPEANFLPEGATTVTSLSMDVTLSIPGIYIRRSRASSPPDDRSLMDFTDQSTTDEWYIDGDAQATITGVISGGPTVSITVPVGEDEGAYNLGANLSLYRTLTLNRAPEADTPYARISGTNWGGTSVGGGAVNMYKPSAEGADWGRTWSTDAAFYAIEGATVEMGHLTGTASGETLADTIGVPYIIGWYPIDAKFDAAGPAYAIEYSSNAITYTDETTYTVDTFSEPTSQVVSGSLSWLDEWEWRRLSSNAIQVRETSAWRETNNEDVGDSTETQNDARAGLLTWGLTATGCAASPFWLSGFGFALPASIDINDTQGLPARASPWVGGAGVTVDPVDNDLWTVAAGASAPAVSRTMATRYWLRMDRLASGYTPGLEYHPDWPIMLKANLDIGTTEDDPAWWTSVPAEDITNWANRRYVLLGITAPRAGNVTLTVAYSVPHPDDPCYTGAAYRWDEFSYTRSQYTLTYTVPVVAGANSCLIDLYENNEAVYIRGAYRIQVVDSLSLALPANTTGSPENWTLTGLALVLDPGTATREEPATHYAFRYKRPWGWIGTHWFGFGGWVDGHDVLEIDYGYSCQQYETKLSSIQHSQHNPDSEATTRLDAAKSLGRLYNELYFQEGFTPSWPGTAPQDSSDNKDADDNRVDTSLYWWDLHQSTEAWTLSNLDVALCAGTYNIAAGVPYTMYFYKFPRGRIHGLSMSSSWDVQRETEGVTVEQYIGGAWALVETLTTDEHGRFVTQPLLELGGPYRIANIGLSLLIANREYTSAWARIPPLSAGEPYIDVDECGLTWLVTEQGGALWVYYLDARDVPPRIEVTQPTAGGGYSRPSIAVRGGELLVAATETAAGNTVLWSSLDRGETWTQVATDLGTGITLGTVAVRPGTGEVLLTGIDASDNVVLRMASGTDLPRDDLTPGVDEITITAATAGARSTCQAHPDGSLIAAVQGSGGVDFYRCRTLTTGFAAV